MIKNHLEMWFFSLFSSIPIGHKCVQTENGKHRIIKMEILGKSVGDYEKRSDKIKVLGFYFLDGKKDASTQIGYSPYCSPAKPLTYRLGEILEQPISSSRDGIYYVNSFEDAISAYWYF